MKNRRFIMRLIVLGLIAVAIGSAFYTAYSNDNTPVKIGDPAPDLKLKNLQGEEVQLSDLKGKGVFINFWATWCDPCKREMPLMDKQYQLMKNHGIEILAINIAESHLVVDGFIRRLGVSFPVLLDSDRAVTQRYGVGALPASFFVDKNGIVVDHFVGEMNERIIKEKLDLIKP
jgi:peroxiredoxin